MVDEPASGGQRRRSAALAILMVGVAAAGALARVPGGGHAPAACAAPALRDGLLVCDGRGAPPGAIAWLAGKKLDVNRASQAELEQIPGVGPSLARAIVEERAQRGGRFGRYAELDDVPGIGPKTLARLEPFLEVAGETTIAPE